MKMSMEHALRHAVKVQSEVPKAERSETQEAVIALAYYCMQKSKAVDYLQEEITELRDRLVRKSIEYSRRGIV